jgi:hypothetical protein
VRLVRVRRGDDYAARALRDTRVADNSHVYFRPPPGRHGDANSAPYTSLEVSRARGGWVASFRWGWRGRWERGRFRTLAAARRWMVARSEAFFLPVAAVRQDPSAAAMLGAALNGDGAAFLALLDWLDDEGFVAGRTRAELENLGRRHGLMPARGRAGAS